jgi:hypothetical protein
MRKYISIILFSTLVFFSGCLKEKYKLDINDNTSRVIAEFTNGDSTTLNSLALDFATGLVEVDLTELRIIPRSNVTGNVEVKIRLNPGLVTAYNTENGTDFEIPPGNIFELPETNFTLTASSKSTTVKIKVDPSEVIGNSYAVGFTIFEASNGEVSQIKKDYLVELKVKNPWDGEYTSNGYLYHPSLPREIIDRPKTLATLSATSVECELGDLGGSGYFAIFEIDASNNVTITIEPGAAGGDYTMFTAGLPSTNPGYTAQWPGSADCNNVYDPVAKEFRVRYGYMGASGWRVTEEVITKN